MQHRVLGLALALAAAAASAADAPAPAGELLAACKADMARLCPGIEPGEGRVKACMKEHRDRLSSECKKELAAARKKSRQAGG